MIVFHRVENGTYTMGNHMRAVKGGKSSEECGFDLVA